jgi:hypothetical protein
MQKLKAISIWVSMLIGFFLSSCWIIYYTTNLSNKEILLVIAATVGGLVIMRSTLHTSLAMYEWRSTGLFWIPEPKTNQVKAKTPFYLSIIFDFSFICIFDIRVIFFEHITADTQYIWLALISYTISAMAAGFIVGRWIRYLRS